MSKLCKILYTLINILYTLIWNHFWSESWSYHLHILTFYYNLTILLPDCHKFDLTLTPSDFFLSTHMINRNDMAGASQIVTM